MVIALVLGAALAVAAASQVAMLLHLYRLRAAFLHVTADRDRISAELDQAYLAGAALAVDRGSPGAWRLRALAALRAGDVANRRHIARACAAVAAHGARELERHLRGASR